MKRTVDVVSMISPGDKSVIFECEDFQSYTLEGEIGSIQKIGKQLYCITGLKNNIDYKLTVTGNTGAMGIRLFRCGEFPGKVINYIHPKDTIFHPAGMCPASPSILKLDSGRILVSHDIFYSKMAKNLTLIYYSDNNGDSWNYLSMVEGCLWGKLFLYKNELYLLGNMHDYGDLVLYKSINKGRNFVKACTIIDGGNEYIGGPHKSAMPILEYNNRIWTAIEMGSWNLGGHACGYISASGDITIKENWIISEFVPYNKNWPGTAVGPSSGCIEGNILIKPDGQMIDFLRYGIDACEPNNGKALYMKIDKSQPGSTPEFGKVVDFHGNHSKFSIKYDNKTSKYWTIVSKADSKKPKRRNELELMSSEDIDTWTVEKTLLDYECNGRHEDSIQVGFQYVDFIFSGDEILYVSRTALNGALNYHDSNCITFHKVKYI